MYDMSVKMHAWDVHVCMVWRCECLYEMGIHTWYGGVGGVFMGWDCMHGMGIRGVRECMHGMGLGSVRMDGNVWMILECVVYAW
jgi:hypothetical protein